MVENPDALVAQWIEHLPPKQGSSDNPLRSLPVDTSADAGFSAVSGDHIPPADGPCGSSAVGVAAQCPHSADDRRVMVCASCLRASCWQGLLYCDEARTASTTVMTVRALRRLARESPSYWQDPEGH